MYYYYYMRDGVSRPNHILPPTQSIGAAPIVDLLEPREVAID
jgi:hypothetical protein